MKIWSREPLGSKGSNDSAVAFEDLQNVLSLARLMIADTMESYASLMRILARLPAGKREEAEQQWQDFLDRLRSVFLEGTWGQDEET